MSTSDWVIAFFVLHPEAVLFLSLIVLIALLMGVVGAIEVWERAMRFVRGHK